MVALELAAENKSKFISSEASLPRSLDSRIPLPTKEPVIPSDVKPDPATIIKAREHLLHPPDAATAFGPLYHIPGGLYIVTAVDNTTLGRDNTYGQTLGGTRVVEKKELLKGTDNPYPLVLKAEKLAKELGSDMTKKWLTLFHMMDMLYKKGAAEKEDVLASCMGGGKSVIVVDSLDTYRNLSTGQRKDLFAQHGRHIQKLNGKHITAVDMNTTSADMDAVWEETPFVACYSEAKGGSGNPSEITARGVFAAAEAILLAEGFDPNQESFAVQGVGAVGSHIVSMITEKYPQAAIFVTALRPEKAYAVMEKEKEKNKHAQVYAVPPETIVSMPATVFMPCANAGILTEQTLENLHERTRFICGAANDQYPQTGGEADPIIVQKYHDQGRIVVPAPLANLGGILDVAGNYRTYWGRENRTDEENLLLAEGVGDVTKVLWEQAKKEGRTFESVYDEMVATTYASFCLANNIPLS